MNYIAYKNIDDTIKLIDKLNELNDSIKAKVDDSIKAKVDD